MAIDHYSPCPCGSGKKLKFCKCLENPQDFEKIVRLLEGGQEVAALDRINQLLKKTPNAAWLLAIKGELTLGMQEIDSFRETANRFLKLKPDNPLALIMTSIAKSIDGEPHEIAARYLLRGLGESRESLPAISLNAIQLLISSLAESGKLSMAGYWADLDAGLQTGENRSETVLSHPDLNLVAKAPSSIIDDPAGSAWKERLAEVVVLARTFRYEQAETKLHAILRDFPGQPGPLSHLLRAQYAQLDQPGAIDTARKLAVHADVPPQQRAYYSAVVMELEPERPALQTSMLIRYSDIESEDDLSKALAPLDYVIEGDEEDTVQARAYFSHLVKNELPAKRLYQIYDRSLASEGLSEQRAIASSVGMIVFFSKQTDRPARVLLLINEYPAYRDRIAELLAALRLENDVDPRPTINTIYSEFLARPRVVVGDPLSGVSPEELGEIVVDEFLNLPIAGLGNQSPLESAQDEQKRGVLLGLLSHLEGEQALVCDASTIDKIYSRLGLERPSVTIDPQSPSLKIVSVLDLDRINLSELSPQQLRGLLLRATSFGAARIRYQCSKAVVECSDLAGDAQIQSLALSSLLTFLPSLEEKLEITHQLEACLVKLGAPVGRLVLQRLTLMQSLGRIEEAQQMLLEAVQKYPEDPYLMSFIQYAMQNSSGGGGVVDPLASRMAGTARPNAEQGKSGLVLPGQSTASGSGESKLWLPGS